MPEGIGFLGDDEDVDPDEDDIILVSAENPLPCVLVEEA